MDMETIEKTAKSARTRARRALNGAKKDAVAQAERTGADVVVAIDRAQHSVSEFGDRAYSSGRDVAARVANEIEARPLAAMALMGGAILAGLSCYMLLTQRRR
jgi:sigma54-dependent transcription regulator